MLTEEQSSFDGKHFRTDGVMNNPKPIRGDLPILIGGSGERKTLRLVAKYADGCNVFGDPERTRHLMGVLDRHCEDVGRDPAEITKTRLGVAVVAPTHDQAVLKAERVRRHMDPERAQHVLMVGDPDSLAEQAQAFVDAGCDGLTFSLTDVHDLESVALLGRAVAPVVGTPVR